MARTPAATRSLTVRSVDSRSRPLDASRRAHGEPCGSDARSRVQVLTSVVKRSKSFPPMPSVTSVVSGVTRRSCGGIRASRKVFCTPVRSRVLAPLHVTSTNVLTFSARATSDG